MSAAMKTVATALMLGSVFANPIPQGPNEAYQDNPNLRTMSQNITFNVVPLNFDVVSSIVAPKKLIPIAPDTSRFPDGWPAGTHPVVVIGSYNVYIEMAGLTIPDSLMEAAVMIPCVDQLEDGETCFNYPVVNYVGGTNGQVLPPTVPAAVGTLEGTTVHQGYFDPSNEALQDIGGGQSTFQADFDVVNNPVSGPGLQPPAIAFTVSHAEPSFIASSGMHYFINQPQIQNNGMCFNNALYFNYTFARPFFTEGTVQLDGYMDGLNGIPDAIAGTYTNFTGYSANGNNIGYNPQTCKEAAASIDPKLYQ